MKKHKDLRAFLTKTEQIHKSDFDALIDLTSEMFTCDALEVIPIYKSLVSSLDHLEKNLWRMYKNGREEPDKHRDLTITHHCHSKKFRPIRTVQCSAERRLEDSKT